MGSRKQNDAPGKAVLKKTPKVGDKVRCVKSSFSSYKNAQGIVAKVFVAASPQDTLYVIRFRFGEHTLSGDAIELVETRRSKPPGDT